MIAACNGAAVRLSAATVFRIVNLELCNGDATTVDKQVNRMDFMCASGAGEVCEHKVVCT